MRVPELIAKKRYGGEMTSEEIRFLVHGYVRGDVPDYQMSAWLMAVCFQGMSARETADLTMAMVDSGDTVDLSEIPGIKVDKHSTGGVGDKTTLVLGPLVAASGVPVAKMSGRGLGHTGGTLDKLESIPGVTISLTRERFMEQVKRIGVAVMGQTGNLVPADGKIYALRDVTGTVESIPLIASSIMSKKIAGGAQAIVLDVKTGSGAFMKTLDASVELAGAMVAIGEHLGRRTVAVVSDMNEPLGLAVGNVLEVIEAAEALKGRGPADLQELCLTLGAQMVHLAGAAATIGEARAKVEGSLKSGAGLEKLRQMVSAQGGDPRALDDPSLLRRAAAVMEVPSPAEGFVGSINALEVGLTAMMLGAGREKKGDAIDPAAGVVVRKKVGDAVSRGEPLALIHYNDGEKAGLAASRLAQAFTLTAEKSDRPPLLRAVVAAGGVRYL